MRHIDFDPATLDGELAAWWNRWSDRADRAKQAVLDDVAADKAPDFKSEIWSELKRWLLDNVFAGKCAYCEIKVTGGFFGDAEHYRPKGRVTVKDGAKTRVVERDGKPHPGYYWLAYDYRNLLPSCERCNSADGKMNQFPVVHEHMFDPEDGALVDVLDEKEDPLLLNPYRDDPPKDLVFGVEGIVAPREGSERGRQSIAVYHLARESLEAERARAQRDAENAFMLALLRRDGISLDEAMHDYIGPHAPFSEAVRDYLIHARKRQQERLRGAFDR